MKLKHAVLAGAISLPLCICSTSYAKDDDSRLANEVETPDLLLQETDKKDKKVRYGDEDIKLSPDGRKNNTQVTPDPLERNLMKKEPDEKTEKPVKKKAKSVSKQPDKKDKKANDDILTPDPLLDMMN